MKKWRGFSVIVAVTLLVAGVALIRHRNDKAPLSGTVPKETESPIGANPASQSAPPAYGQISLKDHTREEAVKLWLERTERDHKADWKMPIRFYGRVVDQQMVAVPNARVHFQWTDLSSKGSSEADAATDSNGSFTFQGAQGKRLKVLVSKDGYYNSADTSMRSFEFSNPGEEIYYEPDSSHPVVFRLQKKGTGEKLISKSVKVITPPDGSVTTVNLNVGGASVADGDLEIQTWKPSPPRPVSPHYDWKAVLKMAGGGFVDAPDEFAFEAPEAGYQGSLEFAMPATSATWNATIEKNIYFEYGTPPKYGRLHFQTSANSRYVFISYVLNPSGSRNLESGAQAR